MLSSHASLTGPAECHGIIVGVVSGRGDQNPGLWVSHIMGDNATAGEPSEALMLRVLEALRQHVITQLHAADMGFQLCVPDDEVSLEIRAGSLVEWCEGFLFGLGLTGLDIRALSAEAQEFITDMGDITRLNVSVAEPLEEDEVNYAELYEYVRTGVQIVYDELHSNPDSENEVLH